MHTEKGEEEEMKVLDDGHKYLLQELDGHPEAETLLQFVKRKGKKYPGNRTEYPGVNCQEVLRALIDRVTYLLWQEPSAETEAIIGNLKSALLLFEVRAARKHGRVLERKKIGLLEADCKKCGHCGCKGDCRR